MRSPERSRGDSPSHFTTPLAARHVRGASSDRECEEAPDDEYRRTSIPRTSPRQCPDSTRATGGSLLGCGDSTSPPLQTPDDEGRQLTLPPSRSWASATPGSMMRGLPSSCRGGSEQPPAAQGSPQPAAPSATASTIKATRLDLRFTSPCKQPKTADGPPGQSPKAAPQKAPCRTLKYYPPPLDNTDQSVDVIDHGSEVLVIRREPSVPPRILHGSAEAAAPRQQPAELKAAQPWSGATHPHAVAPPRAAARLQARSLPEAVALTPEADASI